MSTSAVASASPSPSAVVTLSIGTRTEPTRLTGSLLTSADASSSSSLDTTPAASKTPSRAFSNSPSRSSKESPRPKPGSSNSSNESPRSRPKESAVSMRNNEPSPVCDPSMDCISASLPSAVACNSSSFFTSDRSALASSHKPFWSKNNAMSSAVSWIFLSLSCSSLAWPPCKESFLASPCASILRFSSASVRMPARFSRAVNNLARFSTSLPLVCFFCALSAQHAKVDERIHFGKVATYKWFVTVCSSSFRARWPYMRMARPHCWMKALGVTGTSERKVRRTAKKLMPSEHCAASATKTR
mmetsp:Transcript_105765/g.337840  ORF Transcript_105765/g.337840 Transcript_105765/m.337840 type:complete len:301 (-) Transcript_105765:3449-4351(-)